jgi:hypothetical protein
LRSASPAAIEVAPRPGARTGGHGRKTDSTHVVKLMSIEGHQAPDEPDAFRAVRPPVPIFFPCFLRVPRPQRSSAWLRRGRTKNINHQGSETPAPICGNAVPQHLLQLRR